MNPEDIRDMNWDEMAGHLSGLREKVYNALAKHGPCTTCELAGASGISLLTVRPRMTELCQLGFADCTGKTSHDGVYVAVPVPVVFENWQTARAARLAAGRQMEMNF